ncbi:hypothetical protein V1264_001476 [Littorina saxatilis]|uniref:Uncharacterized protein n=1 Tax=Littorina saxatilis TaxID=31220 RepID=A0AAN9C1I7_9CAEN
MNWKDTAPMIFNQEGCQRVSVLFGEQPLFQDTGLLRSFHEEFSMACTREGPHTEERGAMVERKRPHRRRWLDGGVSIVTGRRDDGSFR